MEVRVSLQVGGEDGTTFLRTERLDPVISARPYSLEEGFFGSNAEVAADHIALARVAMLNAADEACRSFNEKLSQLEALTRRGAE